ncbi:MAG: MFS transporter [Candidatus Paceibacterota bacterium]
MNNKTIFYQLLGNTLFASVINSFVWFAVTFWVFLETESVLATSYIAGIFAVANMTSAFLFGTIVDHNRKKTAMFYSSTISLVSYLLGALIYFTQPVEVFADPSSSTLWLLVVVLMIGSVSGNLRMIALSTTVSMLFTEGKDKANGLVGAMNGMSFAITSVLSGLVIGFLGMNFAIIIAVVVTAMVLIHLPFIPLVEKEIVHVEGAGKKIDFKKTFTVVAAVPGLLTLIFFTTFNNFLGGVFMALMDAYGLSLVSVQTWGMMFAVVSLGFILGGGLIAKYGLGKNPLRSMLTVNVITWTTCIFFTIQPSAILLFMGMLIWMTLIPFIEAAEHTVIQAVVPLEKQGRVFGFAQSIESAATPITTFLIGPIATFFFIPFMTTGAGVELIGDWFGVGQARGIALVFICAGTIGLIVTLIAFRTKSYLVISELMKVKKV